MKIEKKKISELNSASYNPRDDLRPGDPDYEKIKQSIQQFGFVRPIVWNEGTGNIVGGDQSHKVLKDLGYTEVDCVVVNIDDKREKALNIALNKISGRWDMEKLAVLLDELALEGLAEITGFVGKEIEKIILKGEQALEEIGEIDLEKFSNEAFEHKCPRCGFLY
ncbi:MULTISPECIES: ParB N-terminal domain-containing protein [unclassified Dehalobacter]|uniref:ParB N-terminal domain-containing protein n=1 Tax=unclassified Dehalobacter TaxID=2635733 RepID=UPI0010512E43|nr:MULTISPECIES: ParB N-terminal domain-containing protein [unclassified Dehalobacter]TCX51943.1 transcriptional regulator [Dehalobacter sp. 14DCB1]TCX53003.1 transcriptional regulator [Dehalobacter sp. 12DCB1]